MGPESTVHKSSLLCGAPHYNTLHNHTVATDATASQSAQENSRKHPVLLVLFLFVCLFVFETKSHSSPDWPWHPPKAVIISMSHQTWPTFPFLKTHYFLKCYIQFTNLFLSFTKTIPSCQFYCLYFIM